MINRWLNQIEESFAQMVEWRRHMHQHPELSFQEVETPKMIASILEGFGIEVRINVGGRGVVGIIRGKNPGKTIALRADFDALPIQDEKDVPYKSKVNGVMHACGHDGHTATLLAVAKVLQENREQLAGKVVLLHQHAEEMCPGGAISMIEDGCLEGVDAVFGKKSMGENTLIEIDPSMGGEDFAYYLKEKPGMFFYTGARNEKIQANYPHHHPKFNFDEQAMVMAGKGLISIVHHYLASEETNKERKANVATEEANNEAIIS
ncbi:amidohydrolase [Cytobacillus depressus]|uniref:Amidohydrolase n=1 Tax=Cytobacillus depressus TaxID=1602942 RepID=A0A6L3V7X9_9BACI|nr:amidohydrolase [Cytobacillus depressus]KAB2333314.1 amidohydrolase [Cytobacillus depressus]